jgi:hypothetical protein
MNGVLDFIFDFWAGWVATEFVTDVIDWFLDRNRGKR